MKSLSMTIHIKATEQYFPVVLFIMLYKVVLTFESVDKILWCDVCLLYTSPSPRDGLLSRMPSSA